MISKAVKWEGIVYLTACLSSDAMFVTACVLDEAQIDMFKRHGDLPQTVPTYMHTTWGKTTEHQKLIFFCECNLTRIIHSNEYHQGFAI